MRNGPIPLGVHAMAEPFLFALLVAAPFLFGFNDNDTATALSIGAGVVLLLTSLSTNWRLSLWKVVPLPVHMLADIGMGAFLVLSPFLLGFSDESAPTVFFVLFGLSEILASLATRWTHGEDIGPAEKSGREMRFRRGGSKTTQEWTDETDREQRRVERAKARGEA